MASVESFLKDIDVRLDLIKKYGAKMAFYSSISFDKAVKNIDLQPYLLKVPRMGLSYNGVEAHYLKLLRTSACYYNRVVRFKINKTRIL